jgi:hypothetical protein
MNSIIQILNIPHALYQRLLTRIAPEAPLLPTHVPEVTVLDFNQLTAEDFGVFDQQQYYQQRPADTLDRQREIIVQQELLISQQEQLLAEYSVQVQDQRNDIRFYRRRLRKRRNVNWD